MKNRLKALLSVTTLLVLAACGGGDDVATTSANPAPTSAPAPAPTPSNNTGADIVTTDDPTKIQIDGQTITLQRPNVRSGAITNVRDVININGVEETVDHILANGYNFSYVQFAQVITRDGKIHTIVRGNGKDSLTATMPTTGVVEYKGESINNMFTGDAAITVDFAQKELTGKFSSRNADFGGDINLTANITGNQFKGNVTQADKTGTTNGAFFGPNATELGGKFNGNDLNGSFGAKK